MNAHGAVWSKTDDRTFTLTLSEPWGFVFDTLGKPGAPVPFILPARLLANRAAGQSVPEQIGSGPFVFKKDEWAPGSKLVFVKNSRYQPRSEPASGLTVGKTVMRNE